MFVGAVIQDGVKTDCNCRGRIFILILLRHKRLVLLAPV
jgi:hypothetical protein